MKGKWYVNEMLKWYAEYSGGTEGNPRKEVTCFVNHKASIVAAEWMVAVQPWRGA